MSVTAAAVAALIQAHYGLTVSLRPLAGEVDLNFLAQTPEGQTFVVKVAGPGETESPIRFQHALIRHLRGSRLQVPDILPTTGGEDLVWITDAQGQQRILRLLTWIEGRCLAEVSPHTPELMEAVGALCGQLSRGLAGFDHPGAHRFLKWDVSQAGWTEAHLDHFETASQRELARYFFQWFQTEAVTRFDTLRQSVTYHDANDYNLLVSGTGTGVHIPGVIDFGDAVFSHTINELAVAAAYACMHKPDPLAVLGWLAQGYHRVYPLTESEAAALPALMGARLLISVTCSALNRQTHPDNPYLQISETPAWTLMAQLRAIPPALIQGVIRAACGWEPCPQAVVFRAWAAKATLHPIVPVDLTGPESVWLDLGVGSADLGTWADITDPDRLQARVRDMLEAHPGARAGLGRYDEVRPLYTTDAYETQGHDGPVWRTVHIGLDVCLPPGTPVSAPLPGIVHSFRDNAQDRDYGPTVILQHTVSPELTFYTLYGHLSRASLARLRPGQEIEAGEVFCEIGPMPENGNWFPHLHFQVMLDLLGHTGDFPGVAYPAQRTVWTSLCPDPWYLIAGHPAPAAPGTDAADILSYRKAHLPRNLSISYARPLHILRGGGAYLLDDTGRRYLDTVNNVAHVGHEHPRVVRAGQRQMQVLNTNTRYLHPRITEFAAELLATFPAPLEVAFFVNSGSEANELAMRLARTYTGQQDMLVVEVGYHGNTQGCVEVSSYKFDGPGGRGAPPHVHVTPIPDAYRGLYRGFHAATGAQYAAAVGAAVDRILAAGRRPAAFLCESVISCGGQVPLPPGYLAGAAAQVRRGGGLLISDEVQTGCGRDGQHFWAFEAHGVVPDIVTIGKPIGNGHPLGAVVTTRAIADAFANGMEYFNTFGGNPVSCAIGLEVLRVIREEGLQAHAHAQGEYLRQGLRTLAQQFPIIGDVRGPGLFLGFELVQDPTTLTPAPAQTSYLANRMRELGILMSTDGPYHNVLKIKPPMVFARQHADFLLETLARVLREDGMRV
ncbi:MAG: aminotransferase class III-fold pyridoxal phosphate-dependent enzyme [Bacteroidia bacterium]|nr:aminotransferase class III-fold pyridoxal phosphate-dependent enzyme [Bacteroidia bacterium]